MAVARTAGGDKAQNLGLVQLYGLRRSQIVRCQNNRNIGINAACDNTAQDADDTGGDVLDVRRTRLHIGVIHGCEHLCKLLRNLRNRIFRVDALAFDHIIDAVDVIQIIQHHLMRLKQRSAFLADLSNCLVIQFGKLLHRSLARVLKALLLRFRVGNRSLYDLSAAAAVEIDGAVSNALGHAFSLNGVHNCFPPLHILQAHPAPLPARLTSGRRDLLPPHTLSSCCL